ncbi:MAG: thiolase [Brevundimonas subvibrioides]|uniref:propanoyl-CoA C-acyltransferase n=1 Tax=Brevundimonas subvibrioides TaxID=74313 RepID=A0A258HLS9_9CAUL|nr:thiolase family protein [Brevundimonas subvibrioides]OYX57312.1 MAG: thiolase [Brevundimonas subvibrioides]
MSGDVFIAGISMTRFGKRPDDSVKSLTAEAVTAALADAGAAVGDIEAAWFSNTRQPMLEGQNTVRGQIALRPLGLTGIPVVNVENACASGSTALLSAIHWIKAGAGDIALIVGVEKMVWPDRPERVAAAFAGGTDIHDREGVVAYIRSMGGEDPGPDRSLFMDLYAAQARAHMARHGTTQEDFARIASKNHSVGALNERAQYRTPMTVDQVLADKPVVFPFTRAMCAPVSDGAAAAVVCSAAGLARLCGPGRAVRVRACVLVSASDRAANDFENHIGRRAAAKAYEQAGIGPVAVDLVEVHDATAYAEVQQIENLGLAEPGTVGARLRAGDFALGGRTPVNPSGGLVSKGHPVGATGIAQLFELTTQLRGEAGARQVEGARIAAAENGGGFLGVEEAATVVTILERAA